MARNASPPADLTEALGKDPPTPKLILPDDDRAL
jgi:hypothetical protein